jgi:hypothetical protein
MKKGHAVMELLFGKHECKSTELLVLRHPDYVDWMLREVDAKGMFAQAQSEVRRLISLFDEMPIVKPCRNPECANLATRASVHLGRTDLWWWCEVCKPYGSGAGLDKLHIIRSYWDAIDYVTLVSSRPRSDLNALIRRLAEAKGLPSRVGEKQAAVFFAS